MFEKVIQEVVDASVVDFEESGVDQKTLHDLKDVSLPFVRASWCIWTEYGAVTQGRPKAGGTAVLREAVLMGGTLAFETPFICGRRYPLWLRPPSQIRPPHVTLYNTRANN